MDFLIFFFSGYCLPCAFLADKTVFPFKSILVLIEGKIIFKSLTDFMVTDTDVYRISKIYFPILNLILLRMFLK